MMDSDGYPEESELKEIAEWDYRDYRGLMEYVRERWHYADDGYWSEKPNNTYHISTAGWSGNEDIIEALRKNYMFWSLCWWRSERGGHYVFKIPKGTNGKEPAKNTD